MLAHFVNACAIILVTFSCNLRLQITHSLSVLAGSEIWTLNVCARVPGTHVCDCDLLKWSVERNIIITIAIYVF